MAEKRMFAKTIVLSDAFLDMPMSARCLYFTLSMFADDDGFVGSPKGIMRQCGASQDDMAVLLQKRFILGFASGVIAIKHWHINNTLRGDRHTDTAFVAEREQLVLDKSKAYTEVPVNQVTTKCQPLDNHMTTTCQPNGNQVTTKCQPSIDKDSIDKIRLDKRREEGNSPRLPEYRFREQWLTSELADSIKSRFNALPFTRKIRIIAPMTPRWNETEKAIKFYGIDGIDEIMDKLSNSEWLNVRGVKTSYDWFIRQENLQKILEGNYDDAYEARTETYDDKLERWCSNECEPED